MYSPDPAPDRLGNSRQYLFVAMARRSRCVGATRRFTRVAHIRVGLAQLLLMFTTGLAVVATILILVAIGDALNDYLRYFFIQPQRLSNVEADLWMVFCSLGNHAGNIGGTVSARR